MWLCKNKTNVDPILQSLIPMLYQCNFIDLCGVKPIHNSDKGDESWAPVSFGKHTTALCWICSVEFKIQQREHSCQTAFTYPFQQRVRFSSGNLEREHSNWGQIEKMLLLLEANVVSFELIRIKQDWKDGGFYLFIYFLLCIENFD